MWAVAGVLLGGMLIVLLARIHIGPHSHVASAAFGLVAAVWLVTWPPPGCPPPAVGDLRHRRCAVGWSGCARMERPAVSARTLSAQAGSPRGRVRCRRSALDPDGLVKIHGETWSATSMNGNFPAGAHVQVIREG